MFRKSDWNKKNSKCALFPELTGFVPTDVHVGCDSNLPLVAQELMKQMVHQFALEYASKCLLNTSANGVTTRTSSPPSGTPDGPLDLTVSRSQEKDGAQSQPGRKRLAYWGVLLRGAWTGFHQLLFFFFWQMRRSTFPTGALQLHQHSHPHRRIQGKTLASVLVLLLRCSALFTRCMETTTHLPPFNT